MLEPNSLGIDEQLLEGTINMEGDHISGGSDEGAANEHGGDDGGAAESSESPLHVAAIGVLIELVNSRAGA